MGKSAREILGGGAGQSQAGESLDSLDSLVAEPIARRIEAVLALMNRQALGSVRLRENVKTIIKADSSPVTLADLLHQSQLQRLLAESFPDDGLICEEPRSLQEQVVAEAARVSREVYGEPMPERLFDVPERGEITWILDPIDGTKGYIAGRYYAIAVGFFMGDEPLFGAMAVPSAPNAEPTAIEGKLAFAIKGKGAWIADIVEEGEPVFSALRSGAGAAESAAQDASGESRALRVAVSLEHGGAIVERLRELGEVEIVKLDSQAKYLAVAAGVIDVYMRARRNDGHPDVVWDHMPGALIALEAGCRVTHFTGEPIEFEPKSVIEFRRGFVCARADDAGETAGGGEASEAESPLAMLGTILRGGTEG